MRRVLLLFLLAIIDQIYTSKVPDFVIIHALTRMGFSGTVHPRGGYPDPGYARYRRVANGACNSRFPRIIVRPLDEVDVAAAVRVATKFKLDLSVRSGGHGYVCNSIKHDGLHVDLRRMNKVQLLPPSYHDVRKFFMEY